MIIQRKKQDSIKDFRKNAIKVAAAFCAVAFLHSAAASDFENNDDLNQRLGPCENPFLNPENLKKIPHKMNPKSLDEKFGISQASFNSARDGQNDLGSGTSSLPAGLITPDDPEFRKYFEQDKKPLKQPCYYSA